MTKDISAIITRCCKEQGIEYQSCNPEYTNFIIDAKRLGEIVLEIEGLIDEIDSILEKHKVENKLKKIILKELKDLHNLDHDLIKAAIQIKESNR